MSALEMEKIEMSRRVMVALDVNDKTQALAIRDKLGDSVGWFKVG